MRPDVLLGAAQEILELIEFLLEHDTAGDPVTGLKWSRRTTAKVAAALKDFGIVVSPRSVARLLFQIGYSLRVNRKQLSSVSNPDRNEQFLYIAKLRDRFQRGGLPFIGSDTKKREMVGNFKHRGTRWDIAPRLVNDHDFLTDADRVAIPFGIYDLLANRGSVNVGVSHDTPAFAAHSIAQWWQREACLRYPGARRLLLLADTGGSNSSRCHAWKTELHRVIGLPLREGRRHDREHIAGSANPACMAYPAAHGLR